MGPSRPTQLFSHDENVAVPSLLTHVVKAFPSCGTLHIAEVDVGVVGSVHAPAPPPKLASTPHQQPKQQTAAAARKMPLVPGSESLSTVLQPLFIHMQPPQLLSASLSAPSLANPFARSLSQRLFAC